MSRITEIVDFIEATSESFIDGNFELATPQCSAMPFGKLF